MHVSHKRLLGLLVGLAAVAALVFAIGASAGSRDHGGGKGGDHGNGVAQQGSKSDDDNGNGNENGNENGGKLFSSILAPSVPTDPAFHGVKAGGVPWSLSSGKVSLRADGRLDLRVRGLVITGTPTPGPVTTIAASLLCGADAQAGAAATTGPVPLSTAGDARISTTLTLPASCLAPIVVVNPNGNPAAYIAVSGWKS